MYADQLGWFWKVLEVFLGCQSWQSQTARVWEAEPAHRSEQRRRAERGHRGVGPGAKGGGERFTHCLWGAKDITTKSTQQV